MGGLRSLASDRTLVARALAAAACALSAASVVRTDVPRTGAGFIDQTEISLSLQAPDLPAFVPGLVLWLDGSDTGRQFTDTACSTPVSTAGDPVRCWHDARVNGPAVVADSATSATQRTGGISGRSTVRLARSGTEDATLVAPDLLGGAAPDLQVFVVARENVRSGGSLLSLDGTTFSADRRLAVQAPATDGLWSWDAGNATTDRATAGPTVLGAPTLATLWKDPATGTNGLRVNGVHTGTSPGRTDASTTGGVRIGTGIADHDVAEVLVYDRRLSAAQEAAIEAYLAAKWNIPVGADAPGSVSAAASGDRAITLSWQAPTDDGGSAVTDYVVQYRAQGTGSWATLVDGTSTATTATVTGLGLGTTYELRVAAVTSPGTGAWSAVVSAQALAAWTPADMTSGVELWLDAADAASLSVVDGRVTTWRDRSGLGRDVAQADPAEQPAYQATGFGGLPTLDFTNDRLRTTISGSTPGNWTVHAALDVDASSGLRYLIDAETGRFVAATSADPSFAPALYNGSAWVGATAPATGPQVLGWVAEGPSAAAVYRNGSALATGLAYPTPRAVNGPVSIGGHNTTPSYYLDGRLSEVVMAASAATPADRQRVEGYLAHKWGTAARLPADHPYKTVPPLTASPATTPGVPAAVTAVPGDGTIAVSWTAPSSGGSPIRDYVVDYRVAGTTPWLTAADGVSTTTTAAITGLTNGAAYEVRVRAATAAGTGASSAATAAVTPRAYRDAVLADSPAGWWRLGEPSGTTAYSETGGRNATYQGTATLQNAGALAGDADRAANLANTAWAEVPAASAPSLGTSSFTLEAWVRPGSQGGPILDRFLYTQAGANGHQGFTWKLNACDGSAHSRGRCPFLRIWDTTSSNDIQLSTTALPASTWAHLALTVDRGSNAVTLYVDGVAAGTRNVPLAGSIDVDLPLRIGTKTVGPVERFDGVLDEVAVYPSVLSAARIAAHHRAGLSGTNDGVAPATPTGLTATPGDTQIALSWSVAPDADLAGYRLFRDGVLVRQQTGTTVTDTGLTNGTTYAYTVEAYDSRGNRSTASAAVTATPRTVPGAPTALTAQAGDTAVALTWSAPASGGSPITDYVIEVRPSGGIWSAFPDGTSTTTTAVVTGLTTGTTYDFRVAAVNVVGTGATSTTTTATPQPAWTPADISGGLGFWFDAADAATISLDGGAVSEWRDRSGNARHAVQPTAARRPVVLPTGIGSRAAISFDGTDDQFALPATAAQGTAFTIVTAFRPVSGPLFGEYPSAAGSVKNFIQVSGGRLQFDQWPPDGGWAETTTSFSNTSVVAAFDQTAANQRTIYANGSANGSSTEAYSSAAPDQVLIGARGGTAPAWFSGRVGELLAVPNGLSAADRQRVEGYLAHKWGTTASLPANHPYRLVPPTTAAPATAPGAPSAFTAVPGDGNVALSWTAPASNGGTAVRDYLVEYAADAAFTAPVVFADGVSTTTSATVTGLANSTPYWFRIRAVNAAGTGVAASTTVSTIPAAYRESVLADSPVGYWRLGEPSGATAYSETGAASLHGTRSGTTATAAGAVGSSADLSGSFDGTTQSITVADQPAIRVTGSQTIELWLRPTAFDTRRNPWAQSYSGEGTLTQEADGSITYYYGPGTGAYTSFALPAGNLVLNQWQHVVLVRDMATRTVRWYVNGTQRAVGDVPYTSIGASGAPVRIGAGYVSNYLGGIDEVALYDTALSAERIAAHHRAGLSGTNDGIAPAVPTGLTAAPADTQVALSWNVVAASDLAGYRVFRDGVLVRQQTGTTFTDTGLTNGTTYAYTVEAYDTRGNRSAVSTAVSATPRTVPGAPTSLTATASGDRTITLAWSAAPANGSAVTDYVIEVRPSGGSWSTFADGTSTATSAVVTGLSAGTTYDFRVTAVNAIGTGPASSIVSASVQVLWSPADLSGGLAAWFDASDPTTVTSSGGFVSGWRDRSGNSRDVAATGAAQPTVSFLSPNGRTALEFDSSDWMSSALPLDLTTGATVYLAGRNDVRKDYNGLLRVAPTLDAQESRFEFYWQAGTGGSGNLVTAANRQGNFKWVQANNAGPTAGSWYVVGSVVDPATPSTATQYVQGSAVGVDQTWASGTLVPAGAQTLWIGSGYGSATGKLDGAIGEIVVAATPLASADRQRVEGYLAHKWGTAGSLPANHPYRLVPPTTATPATAPGVPGQPAAVSRDGAVQLTWTVPATNGGTAVRDYVVQYATDSAFTAPVAVPDGVTATASTTVTGLTNGTAYWFRVAAVNAAGTGSWSTAATATPSTLWTPADLGGLALWLDAADSSTVVQSAGSVSQWNDKSGNGRHAVQTTAANQPAYDAAGLNSRGAVVWPNTANGRMLTVPAFAAQDWWFATRYADGARSTWIAGHQGLFGGVNGSESFIGFIAAGNGSATYANGGYPTGRINGGAEVSMLGRTVLPMPASIVHSRRADPLTSSSGWNLGMDRSHTSLNRGWSGPVGEVVVTGSAPSDADRLRLEGYLAHKWGTTALLPTDHPYKSAPPRVGLPTAPTGVTAATGDGSLTVSWTAPDAGYGLADYTVQYRLSPAGTWTTFADGTSTAASATITGLTANTTYDVRVAVIGAAGTSAWSTAASATTSTAWTPADLTGVVLWLDAADSSTLTLNGATVSQWSDKSGNGRHVGQATASMRPTPVSAAQNGRTVLRFDGGDALSTTAFPTTGWTGLSVFTTARWTTVGTSVSQIQALVDNNHDATNGFVLQDRPDLANRPLSGFVDDTAQTGNGTWRLIGATRSWGAPALNRLRVDGAQRSEATNTLANSFRNQFHVGAWNGTGRFLNGDIGDVLVVNGVLATADLQRVEGYLAHKWGTTVSLPVDHPYKSAPPRAGLPTAPTGLTAAGGDGSLSVSWAAPDAGYAITDYTVQYRLSPAGTWTTFADGTSATTGATITGLPANTAYDVRVAAIGAAGTSAWSTTATATTSTAWTPADLTGAALWLDADDASTITRNGSTVSQWNDKSGNARHVSQGAAANQPTSTTSGLNGRNALSFAGSRWLGNTASSLTGTGTYTGPFNVFYAGAPGANGGTVLTERSSTLVGVSQWTNLSGTYFLSSDGANNSSNNQLTSATFARFSSAGGVVAHQHVPAARDNVWLNGTAETVTAGTAGNISGGTGFRIGTREFTGVGWDGSVGEIVVSTTALSTTDRQRLEGYLAHKWGTTASLPADHPYKSAPPRAGLPTAPAGFTATPGDTSIALTWTAPEAGYAVSDYVIEYRTSPSGSWTTFPDGTSTATSATITGLTPGTAYDVRVAAVSPAGTGAWATATATPAPLWTPAQLTGVALWLDAADAATLTRSGSAVSQWSDKSGSGNHAVQATVASQPTYNAATTGIDTGTSNWLGFDQQLLTGATSASIFVTGNQTSGQSSWGHIGCCTNHHGPWSDGKLYDSFASNSRPGSTLALTSPWANTLTVLGYEQSGAALEFWQTGRSLGSAATTFRIPANTSSEQRLGPTYTNTYRLHEVVLVRRVLAVADRQRLEGYLAWKWGAQAQLPADHPYKLAAPRVP